MILWSITLFSFSAELLSTVSPICLILFTYWRIHYLPSPRPGKNWRHQQRDNFPQTDATRLAPPTTLCDAGQYYRRKSAAGSICYRGYVELVQNL